jgi:RimJ/RimL family protein N-acetyltransferase
MPSPYTLDDARSWITEGAPSVVSAGGQAYGIADPASDRIIGGVGLSRRAHDCGEIGYWVAPSARGRGIATQAARLIAAHAFAKGTPRLELRTEPENVGSQRVAIAAGFTRESVARGAGATRDGDRADLIVWARLASDSGKPVKRLIPDLPEGELSDGVVTLRPLTADDADDTYALRSLPECVLRSVPPVAPERDELARRCAHAPSLWLAGTRAELTIRDAGSGAYAGEIGLHYGGAGIQQAMIGYSMTREWRGRGLVTRAVNLLVDWAFEHLSVVRIIAGTAPDNGASQRVLARAGFEREAYQRALLPGPDDSRIDDIQWVRFRPRG